MKRRGEMASESRAASCLVVAVLGGCSPAPSRGRQLGDQRVGEAGTGLLAMGRATAAPSSSFRAATFNAGLAVGVVKLASERAEPVAAALPNLDADFICLQEVWLDEHWKRIVAATST